MVLFLIFSLCILSRWGSPGGACGGFKCIRVVCVSVCAMIVFKKIPNIERTLPISNCFSNAGQEDTRVVSKLFSLSECVQMDRFCPACLQRNTNKLVSRKFLQCEGRQTLPGFMAMGSS